jgi:hypothetical protein
MVARRVRDIGHHAQMRIGPIMAQLPTACFAINLQGP